MRKKVLFIIGTLQSGGVSKSVVSLINAMDREKFDVHLLVLSTKGDVFSQYLPPDISVHTNEIIENLHNGLYGVTNLIKVFKLWYAFISVVRMIVSRFNKSLSGIILAKAMPKFSDEEYDLIVDYGGQQLLYYMVDKLEGRKKVSFFHSDYAKWHYYFVADKYYYPRVDHIFTISELCKKSLIDYFPNCKNKISVMENISSPQTINKLSGEEIDIPKRSLMLCTIGHVSYNKGFDFIIEAAKVLKKLKIDFLWIIVGKILDKEWITMIHKANLADNFLFTGIKSNPYPFLKIADIYVHPSRFEGKSIALDEAKILCKPIVVTNFSTVNDQFTDRINASLCKMEGDDLAEKIYELYKDNELRERYIKYLSENIKDNTCEAKKLLQFMN